MERNIRGVISACPEASNIIPFADRANGVVNAYLAVISSDLTCAGGSGTSTSALVLLRTSPGQEGSENALAYLKVDADMSAPVAPIVGAPRAITGFQQRGGQLYAHGVEYGPDDANCCPSVKTSFKVSLRKKAVGTPDVPRDIYTWVLSPVKK